jgi:hypothetical protein
MRKEKDENEIFYHYSVVVVYARKNIFRFQTSPTF